MCEKLEHIKELIRDSLLRSGRKNKIKIVAVSKKKSSQMIEELYHCGHRIFGENYVQEALPKMNELSKYDDIEWHFIGHLQTNKAKHVALNFNWIETVDSIRLVKKLNKYATNYGREINCLIQVNIAKESTKSGILEEKIDDVIEAFADCNSLKLRGLMCIPPKESQPERTRGWFKKMYELFMGLKIKYPNYGIEELSMGMSNDFQIAVEEGATIVRIGTAIFGPRER